MSHNQKCKLVTFNVEMWKVMDHFKLLPNSPVTVFDYGLID